MFRNSLAVAWRNLRRHRLFTGVNIAGLSLGLCVCLLIVSYVRYEFNYDRFHAGAERIYRVVQQQEQNGSWYAVAKSPAALAPALRTDFPEVTQAARLSLLGENLLTTDRHSAVVTGGVMTDRHFLALFDFPLLAGTPETALAEPDAIVLTPQLARRFFGTEAAVGRTLRMGEGRELRVTGIIAPAPAQSHLQYDYLLPLSLGERLGRDLTSWNGNAYYTYVRLNGSDRHATVDQRLAAYAERTYGASDTRYYLQPLTDIHLRSAFAFNTDFGTRGDIRYLYLFGGLGLLVLVLAALNFVQLSLARALSRHREIQVRKVIGARRADLLRLLLTEAALYVGLALGLAIAGAVVLAPVLAGRWGVPLDTDWQQPGFGLVVGGLFIVTVLLAALYPALLLANQRFRGIDGQRFLAADRTRPVLTRGLIVGQFGLSIALVIGLFALRQQLNHLSSAQLGLHEGQIVHFRLRGTLREQYSQLRQELLRQPVVAAVSGTNFYSMPFNFVGSFGGNQLTRAGAPLSTAFNIHHFQVDFDFLRTTGIELLAGRPPDPNRPADSTAYLLNRTAAERLGLTAADLGSEIAVYDRPGPLIGITTDFHFQGLATAVEPAVLAIEPAAVDYALVRLQPGTDAAAAASTLRQIAARFSGDYPVSMGWLRQDYEKLYRRERTIGRLFAAFTGLALVVSCLGLFGVAAFRARRRAKELSIRRVLGASAASLVLLLSREFIFLVGLAFLLACPLAWLGIRRWLAGFAYRSEPGLGLFLLAGALVLGLALLPVGWRSWRAAQQNPGVRLREE